MIRLIYGLLVLIEMALVLAALVLFIITDSRTIKYIAKTSLDSSGLSYESVEGNLFDGLEVKKLSYDDKPLFDSALIHWNPLSLFYNKITITKFDAQGIELKNIIAMANTMKSKKSDERVSVDFALTLKNTHLDINPYVYEGVKFSSFILETGKIEIDQNLSIDANSLYLKFDSDIVNVKMKAKIKDSQLLVDNLDLKNISLQDITRLTARLKSKYKKEKRTELTSLKQRDKKIAFLKNIKLKHIKATMKATHYGDLKIEKGILHLYDSMIEPANNFTYQVKKVEFKSKINYEGVKFSSFILETGKIEIDQKLSIDANSLYLKFDSDIVNVKMKAKIKDSQLLVDNLDLKNISLQDITRLTARLKSKYKKEKRTELTSLKKRDKKIAFLKNIKLKHIKATMKATQYGDLKIEKGILHLYDSMIEPANNFTYQVKDVDFKGKTNFGKLDYKGYVQDANILAEGTIILDKELFKKYHLPLNFQALKTLRSTLHLNHNAVSIDIEHKVNNLLEIENDFNIDVFKAKHTLDYDYSDRVFTVDSELEGIMTYAEKFKLKNNVRIDSEGFRYWGKIKAFNPNDLPEVISEYLLREVDGTYEGNTHNFEMNLDSELIAGHLSMPKYKAAEISLKSKGANVELNKLLSDLPIELENEKISFSSKSFFDFQNLKKSEISLLAQSQILDLDAKMKLRKPFEIDFISTINNDSILREMLPKLKFTNLKNLKGRVKLEENNYIINVDNQELKLFLDYNSLTSTIEQIVLNIGGQEFNLERNNGEKLIFQTNISNIQGFLENINYYYELEVPNIQGEVDLRLEQQANGTFWINFKSPKLQYLSEESVDLSILNFYNIDTTFQIDKDLNIEISNYQFKLDENGYLDSFYSTKVSSLVLKNKILKINKLWINDKIEIIGDYNLENLIGDLKVTATRYELSTKDFSLILDLDLNVKLDKKRINIEGDIDILGDTITYEVIGTDIVEDSDIIIVEDIIRKKESTLNNLKLYIKIKSKKPLTYIADNVNVEFLNELSLLKNYNQKMLLTGVTTITKGYYQLEDKQFILNESHLYFTGDIKAPLLDIKASYEKDEYNVHVFISGTTDIPIVNFNSEPYLTQQEILSLILFDGTGSSSGKGAEAYTLLGGTFAKGLIKSLGIDVDHLLLGQGSDKQLSLEVGRKISKDISVLYLHRDGLDGAKVRIEHSKNFETDIIIQPPNTSSIEFLYKQDR